MLELLRTDKAGEARWYSKIYEWTDHAGRYRFDRVSAGSYTLSVHYYGAPNSDEPFATMFYPGIETERGASHIIVAAGCGYQSEPVSLWKTC